MVSRFGHTNRKDLIFPFFDVNAIHIESLAWEGYKFHLKSEIDLTHRQHTQNPIYHCSYMQ